MAVGMLEISNLPMEDLEEILSRMASEEACPIEIDDKIYYIPSAVNELIENLYRQSYNFLKGDNGIPQNKE